MLNNKSKKSSVNQEQWDNKEAINWSSTEGYEAVKQVNNFLRWPSVWADKKNKAKADVGFQPESSLIKPVKSSKFKLSKLSKPPKPPKPVKPIKPAAVNLDQAVTTAVSQHSRPEPGVFWQGLVNRLLFRKSKRANQLRNRQIKQSSASSVNSHQVDKTSFQAKESRRRAVVERSVHQSSSETSHNNTKSSAVELSKSQVEPEPKVLENNKKEVKASEIVDSEKAKADNLSDNQQQRFKDLRQNLEQKSWSRPAITETNLVNNQTTLYFNWNKFWLDLIQWLVVTLFFLSLCGSLFYLWRRNQTKQVGDIVQRLARINRLVNLTENEVSGVLDFRLRLIMVSELLNKHIYWNNFFSFLEKNTLPNVFYQDFIGDTNGDYILKARTDNFDSMAKQLKVFRQSPDVLEVSSEGGEMVKNEPVIIESSDEEQLDNQEVIVENIVPVTQLNFSIRLKIKPELFSR